MNKRILFIGKNNHSYTRDAIKFCKLLFANVQVYLGDWGEPVPKPVIDWHGDIIISYLSRWIVPKSVLASASIAINFHPAPPEYPGFGPVNFALYDQCDTYGVTCHLMEPRVDSGKIISVRRFPILPSDDVASLLNRTYQVQLELFKEIAIYISNEESLPTSSEVWAGQLHKRSELDLLSRISPDMTASEIERRVRATTYMDWAPYIEVAGYRFKLDKRR